MRHGGRLTAALPVAPPEPSADGSPLQRHHIDEALCLARFFDKRADAASMVASRRAPVMILIFRFLKFRCMNVEHSASSSGSTRSNASITVTWLPNDA